MNPFGVETPAVVQQLAQQLNTFYTCTDQTQRKQLDVILQTYMKSERAITLLGAVFNTNNTYLILFACNAFLYRLKSNAFSPSIFQQLFLHVLVIFSSVSLPPFLVQKMLNIISLMIGLDLIKTPRNPLDIISTFTPAGLQLQLFHQLYLVIDTLPATEATTLQAVLARYQTATIEALLALNTPEAVVVISDAVAYSSTFPRVFVSPLLTLILANISRQTNVDDALDLFMNVFIRDIVVPPLLDTTYNILRHVNQLKTYSCFKTLLTFCISFYDTPLLMEVAPSLFVWCNESIDYCIETVSLFEELYTCYDDSPQAEQNVRHVACTFLQILVPQCALRTTNDDKAEARTHLVAGLNCVAEVLGPQYPAILAKYLALHDPAIAESVRFLLAAVGQQAALSPHSTP